MDAIKFVQSGNRPKHFKETKNKHFYPSTVVEFENVSIFAYLFSIYPSLYACIWFLWWIFVSFSTCVPDACHLPSPLCYLTWIFQNRPQFLKSSVAHFSFIWKDMFDLDNTKRSPYFLCIWAKLEVGSRMGYLWPVAVTSDQQTDHDLWGSGGQGGRGRGPVHFPNLYASLCHRGQEWQANMEICGLGLKWSLARAHTTLRNHIHIQNGSVGTHTCIHANINASNVSGKMYKKMVAIEEGLG